MPDVTVERLTLRISGVSPEEAAALARYVAEGLGGSALPSGGRTGSLDRLSVRVRTDGERDLRRVAELAVAEIVHEMAREQ
ncbi:MAG TPA: hypothetical protein VGJ44_18815 [Kribbellaceae bacterium]|jgi:hypothetical protein